MWILWLARNDKTFNNVTWSRTHIEVLIWTRFIDYGRVAWTKVLNSKFKSEKAQREALDKFDAAWAQHTFICQRSDMKVAWEGYIFYPG
jgi:hypothetical protein